MLRAAEPVQQAFFKETEERYAHLNFKWADMLKDARGRSHAEMAKTTTAIGALDLTDATATATGLCASDGDGRVPVTEDEQAAAMVDMCRHTLDMSKAELLGSQEQGDTDWLQARVNESLEACKVEAVQAKASYPLSYHGKEFQVCCLLCDTPHVGPAAQTQHAYTSPRGSLAQITKEGVLAILRHRKALLQVQTSDIAPEVAPECVMHDWVAGAGADVFTNIVKQLFRDDAGLSDMLEVLCESATSKPAYKCMRDLP